MDDLSIPMSSKDYDLHKYGPKIQEWLNSKYGKGKFRIMVLKDIYDMNKRPIWFSRVRYGALPLIMYKDQKGIQPLKPKKKHNKL